jgi:hypothetical protein
MAAPANSTLKAENAKLISVFSRLVIRLVGRLLKTLSSSCAGRLVIFAARHLRDLDGVSSSMPRRKHPHPQSRQ